MGFLNTCINWMYEYTIEISLHFLKENNSDW